jgi:hypothetical protein
VQSGLREKGDSRDVVAPYGDLTIFWRRYAAYLSRVVVEEIRLAE